MPRQPPSYICEACGARHRQWVGRCDVCTSWNSIVEAPPSPVSVGGDVPSAPAVELADVPASSGERRSTGMPEVDRVLGGGLVPGSLVLVGGDPGIGKSTLILQIAANLAAGPAPCLYLAAEESAAQIRLRAERLGIAGRALFVYPETEVEAALGEARRLRAGVIAVDSIQTVRVPALDSAPGTVSQVREAAMTLLRYAKANRTPVFVVGHVTKDGTVAGPRTLEHLVDTVLYLEGEEHYAHRLLRCVKNRFGPAYEVAVLEMRSDGLREVANPSALFLAERDAAAPGSAVAVPMEGTRPVLVEVQALVAPTSYSLPRRLASGFDPNRLNMLLAVLTRRAGLPLADHDVYVNVVGGLRLREPAADLAVALAVASSFRGIAPGVRVAAIGEVGLAGELRSVPATTQRVEEARRVGFDQCLLPVGPKGQGAALGAFAAENLMQAIEMALA
ncbi:MAG: DNA repair protein RadA [Actinobacteria bacterium]|nr:DNA repair protein RadA [Actinomycetota bacterium]